MIFSRQTDSGPAMVLSRWLQLFQRQFWLSGFRRSPRSEIRRRRRRAEYTDVPAFFEHMEARVLLTDLNSFSITGASSVTEDVNDADNNNATYTISRTGTLAAGVSASVNVGS